MTGGKLVVFEGLDGVGKSTISQLLATELLSKNIPSLWMAFPGQEKNTIGAEVHNIHHDVRFKSSDQLSIQLLHVAAHIDAIKTRILPALNEGKWVILDRFWWSTLVYGSQTNADRESLKLALEIEKKQWHGVLPDMVFLVERDEIPDEDQVANSAEFISQYRQLFDSEKDRYPVQILQNNSTKSDAVNIATSSIFNLS